MAADYAVYMSALLALWSVARQYKAPRVMRIRSLAA